MMTKKKRNGPCLLGVCSPTFNRLGTNKECLPEPRGVCLTVVISAGITTPSNETKPDSPSAPWGFVYRYFTGKHKNNMKRKERLFRAHKVEVHIPLSQSSTSTYTRQASTNLATHNQTKQNEMKYRKITCVGEFRTLLTYSMSSVLVLLFYLVLPARGSVVILRPPHYVPRCSPPQTSFSQGRFPRSKG